MIEIDGWIDAEQEDRQWRHRGSVILFLIVLDFLFPVK